MTTTKTIFRMSHAGSCSRILTAEMLGYKPIDAPDWLQEAADEGKVHEELVKNKLRKLNYVISNEQEEVTLEFDEIKLIGHIDGKIISDKLPLSLLEVKSMGQFEFDRWMREGFKGFRNYQSQMTLYLQATGLQQCLYAVKNRSSGFLDIKKFVRDAEYYHNVIVLKQQLETVIENVADKELHHAEFDEASIECRRCRFQYLCRKPIVYTEADAEYLSYAAETWRLGKDLVAQGEKKIDEARGIFENHLKATEQKKIFIEGVRAQLYDKKSESYDKAILQQIFKADDLLPALKKKEWTELRIEDMNNE